MDDQFKKPVKVWSLLLLLLLVLKLYLITVIQKALVALS